MNKYLVNLNVNPDYSALLEKDEESDVILPVWRVEGSFDHNDLNKIAEALKPKAIESINNKIIDLQDMPKPENVDPEYYILSLDLVSLEFSTVEVDQFHEMRGTFNAVHGELPNQLSVFTADHEIDKNKQKLITTAIRTLKNISESVRNDGLDLSKFMSEYQIEICMGMVKSVEKSDEPADALEPCMCSSLYNSATTTGTFRVIDYDEAAAVKRVLARYVDNIKDCDVGSSYLQLWKDKPETCPELLVDMI